VIYFIILEQLIKIQNRFLRKDKKEALSFLETFENQREKASAFDCSLEIF